MRMVFDDQLNDYICQGDVIPWSVWLISTSFCKAQATALRTLGNQCGGSHPVKILANCEGVWGAKILKG